MSTSLTPLFTQVRTSILRMIDNGSGGYCDAKRDLDALLAQSNNAEPEVRVALDELNDAFGEYCCYVDSYDEADDDYHNAEADSVEEEEFDQLRSDRLDEVATAKSELEDALDAAKSALEQGGE